METAGKNTQSIRGRASKKALISARPTMKKAVIKRPQASNTNPLIKMYAMAELK
jgi:hypothetical protein